MDINYFEDWLNESNPVKKDMKMFYVSSHPNIYRIFEKQAKEWSEKKSLKFYNYFITFTTTPETLKGSEEFLISQKDREGLKLKEFMYVKEHAETNLHYHVYLSSTKALEKQDFKHWIKTRGHVDFKRVTPGTEGQTKSYFYKEGTPQVLL